jgi:hypothetical protein
MITDKIKNMGDNVRLLKDMDRLQYIIDEARKWNPYQTNTRRTRTRYVVAYPSCGSPVRCWKMAR